MSSKVQELFVQYCPDLVDLLENSGGFWPKVADNTIGNDDLVKTVRLYRELGRTGSRVYQASLEMILFRANGELSNGDGLTACCGGAS